jgi:hypothetical protein
MIPLFKQYPLLREKLPYVSLGEFPTPVQKLDRIGRDLGMSRLYIKRDDLSGRSCTFATIAHLRTRLYTFRWSDLYLATFGLLNNQEV